MDVYADCAWPERFTRKDLERRRKRHPHAQRVG
jgi:hypothetical protein